MSLEYTWHWLSNANAGEMRLNIRQRICVCGLNAHPTPSWLTTRQSSVRRPRQSRLELGGFHIAPTLMLPSVLHSSTPSHTLSASQRQCRRQLQIQTNTSQAARSALTAFRKHTHPLPRINGKTVIQYAPSIAVLGSQEYNFNNMHI